MSKILQEGWFYWKNREANEAMWAEAPAGFLTWLMQSWPTFECDMGMPAVAPLVTGVEILAEKGGLNVECRVLFLFSGWIGKVASLRKCMGQQ